LRVVTDLSSISGSVAVALLCPARQAKRMAVLGVGLLALLGGARIARAQGDALTLDLPPSRAAQAARDAAARRASSSRPPAGADRRSQYPSRRNAPRETVVGRLGLLGRSCGIFRQPNGASFRLTTAPAGTYLAVRQDGGAWYGILMSDGSMGWVRKQNVQPLNYEVVATGGSLASLPPGADDGDIYPRGAVPFFTGDPQRLLTEAYRFLGVRYVWGGNTMSGIDCSGFVKQVFGSCGFSLPRLGSDQMAYGVPVPTSQLLPGDRLYFGRRHDRLGVTHTGIYIGNGYFIHSSSSRHGVAVTLLSDPMFARIYVCARR
jgi:cell wall-associated NlpC family hydrolase